MSDVLVLCYHALSADWPADLSVTPERFEAQLEVLRSRGYSGATFMEAITAPPAARTVAITFDDAYRSLLDMAFPIMRGVGFTGPGYGPTGWAARPTPM